MPQNRRGGRVKLQSILLPETEFNDPDKGDALYAMEVRPPCWHQVSRYLGA